MYNCLSFSSRSKSSRSQFLFQQGFSNLLVFLLFLSCILILRLLRLSRIILDSEFFSILSFDFGHNSQTQQTLNLDSNFVNYQVKKVFSKILKAIIFSLANLQLQLLMKIVYFDNSNSFRKIFSLQRTSSKSNFFLVLNILLVFISIND